MIVQFLETTVIQRAEDIRTLRAEWTKALGSWHSPYKAIIDLDNVEIAPAEDLEAEWQRFSSFLKGFFLKVAYTYNFKEDRGHAGMPFPNLSEEEAREKVGLNRQKRAAVPGDLRAAIQIQNHFQQHVMEITFEQEAVFADTQHVDLLKSKITNNLMQWHSPWNLLIDCSLAEFKPESHEPIKRMVQYFKSFFLKEILGYSPRVSKELYPFKVYRARHGAAGRLESEGLTSGSQADCNSRKS